MLDSEGNKVDDIFAYLAPDIAMVIIAQWEKDGKPVIKSIEIGRGVPENMDQEIIYAGIVYKYVETDAEVNVEEKKEEVNDSEASPSEDWYAKAVERLENGESDYEG